MKTIIFNAPEQDTLIVDDNTRVQGGDTAVVSDAQADELASASWTNVHIVDESGNIVKQGGVAVEKQLEDHTRSELNDMARQAGVEAPTTLSSKEDVIDAINEAREPEAYSAGPDTNNDDEEVEEE